MAPFEDFRAEAGRGGRIRKAQLAYLLRWLGRNRVEALSDFWSRAELTDPANPKELTTSDLEWGIQRLLKSSVCGWPARRLKSYVGDQDSVANVGDLKNRSRYLNVVAGAGHDLLPLAKGSETSGMNFEKKAGLYHKKARIQKFVADWCAEWIEEERIARASQLWS